MDRLWGPRVIAPRGVYEDVCWAIDDPSGFYLLAIDSRGFCVARALVHDHGEFDVMLSHLTTLLNERDPVTPCASSDGGGMRLVR